MYALFKILVKYATLYGWKPDQAIAIVVIWSTYKMASFINDPFLLISTIAFLRFRSMCIWGMKHLSTHLREGRGI